MHALVMYNPDPPSGAHVARLRARHPELEVTVAGTETHARSAAPTVDIILGHRYLRQVLPHAPTVRWVQSTSGDTDRLPEAELAERGIVLTRFTGGAEIVARHGFALAWSLTRDLPTLVRQQSTGAWAKDLHLLPAPSRALILGTGAIGQALGHLLQGIGVHVTGVKRRVDGPVPGFDDLLDRSTWRERLPTTDWCFLALPHTPTTVQMMDELALRALPSHAVLVNVGRGETIDLTALTNVLDGGHLGGAALDVLPAPLEPLPPEHDLWTVPRLVISPHVAGYDPRRPAMVEAFVEDQVARYLSGRPLHHVVAPRLRTSTH